MSIPLIPPPQNLDEQTKRWLNDLMNQVSASFQEQELLIKQLRDDVESLKAKP